MKMFSKISVLIPTRNRTHRLATLLDSYWQTSFSDAQASELLFRVDDDDEPTRDMLKEFSVTVGPRLDGYASLPVFFNELADVANGDVLMLGNDDMVFRTDRWASRLLTVANDFPDGLFDLGVSTHNETHYPFATVSKRVCDRLGFIADPQIFWADMYLRDVMLNFGRCVMVPDVHIEHDWAGHAPDQTFMDCHRDPASRRADYWTVVHPQAVKRAITVLEEMFMVSR